MTITGPRTDPTVHATHPRDAAAPVVPPGSRRVGVGIDQVHLDPSGFWGRRQHTNRRATLEHCRSWMEQLGWLENFDRVARGDRTSGRPGWQFSDSEVYKLLEAMAWELGRLPDDDLQQTYDTLVERVRAAQDADGYLNTAFGHPGLPARYSDMAMGHELYNIGHLLQAAVARLRTHGTDALVETAKRAADHVWAEFGEYGRPSICGHPEIEVGLMEFGRALKDDRYIRQAALFLERRGHGILPVRPLLSAEYFQDDQPIRSATVLRGHAVRALYLSAAAVDAAVDDGDLDFVDTLERQWAHTVERRTYLTGGMGSRHQDEGFGDDFELPADRAYCETCAGVGSVMFAWRLYLATGDVRYADLIERTLFNVIATSPSEDGRAFFYANPLQQRVRAAAPDEGVNARAEGGSRAPWFDVSCCPTNVARTFASLAAYSAADDDGAAVILQYMAGRVAVAGYTMDVETQYPVDGRIRITVVEAPTSGRLRLRIPSWSAAASLAVSGRSPQQVGPGWAHVEDLVAGDVVDLDLDVAPRLTWPDPRIDAVRASVAVERGPLVLCVESTDLPPGVDLQDIAIDTTSAPRIHGDGAEIDVRVRMTRDTPPGRVPYGAPSATTARKRIPVSLIPYHRWAERWPTTMRVFLPVE